MTYTERIESVARVLWERGHPPCNWEELNEDGNEYAKGGFLKSILDDARAADRATLLGIREPAPEMGEAIYAAWDGFGEDAIMGPEEAIAIHRAVIDKLLEDK